ncbi:MAG TPA: DUF2059 domain-containing protein [Alphaproteobacteria bacterium]|nr:DUF2059 domain-containing protein [Alphaproteobacteria bacterium]
MNNKITVPLLLAALALPVMAQAIEKQGMTNEEAIARLTYARQAIKLDPPRDALLDSPLAGHPMFNQVFNSLDEAKLNETAAQLMAESFTGAELKALVAFQNSPEGRSIRQKMPAYQKVLGATLQNYLTIAFQQIMAKQGSASNLPVNTTPAASGGNLPPMVVPEAATPAPSANPAAVNLPSTGVGTPLKH